MNKRRGLGRGLEALIPSGEYVDELSTDNRARRRFALQIAIADIRPNPEQPRRGFEPASLRELADSIRIHGILQPLLVREGLAGYELIAGERRLRAAEIAGLTEVPVIVHPGSGGRLEERLELALVENLQRTDLNPMEEDPEKVAHMREQIKQGEYRVEPTAVADAILRHLHGVAVARDARHPGERFHPPIFLELPLRREGRSVGGVIGRNRRADGSADLSAPHDQRTTGPGYGRAPAGLQRQPGKQ